MTATSQPEDAGVVLFDLDGTLTDPYEGITRCVAFALERQGIVVSDRQALRGYIGPPLKQAFMRFHGLSDAAADRAVADYRERFGDVGLYENRVYAGMPELLAALRDRGRRLFVATSKPTVYAERIVEHFGLAACFERVHGSQLDGRHTDKRELLAALLESEALTASQAVMIGDRAFDIVGARANGLASVAVTYGYADAGELDDAAPDHQVDDVAALTALLTGVEGAGASRE